MASTTLPILDGCAPESLPPIGPGFEAGPAIVPSERVDVPLFRRERAAAVVLAIATMQTPEECVGGGAVEALDRLHEDTLDRQEAMAYVDLLLDALAPRAAVT
jgi:hypothetical protein